MAAARLRKARPPCRLQCSRNLSASSGRMAWYKEVFDFPSWASDQICCLCEANTSDTPHTDFRSSALWRRSRVGAAAFFNKQGSNGILPSDLFQCPGFSLGMVVIDAVHCLDLGVNQRIIGNIFPEALDMFPAARVAGRLSLLWARNRTWYAGARPPCL